MPTIAIAVMIGIVVSGCAAPSATSSTRSPAGAQGVPELVPPADGVSLLSRYPQSPALALTRETYVEAAAGRTRDSVFMTTWFPRPDARVGEWSTVDSRGRVAIYRFVHDVGFQDSQSTTLADGQLAELGGLLGALTPSSPPPTLDRALLVGFRHPVTGEWVTRLYDRTAPPETVGRIFHEMTGASLRK